MEKRSIDVTQPDPTVADRPGWEGLQVWWLVSRDETSAERVVVNVTVFPPNCWHEVHRHPNCEEALYVLEGSGLHLSDGEPVRQRQGEVVYIPAGEWHGFANDNDTSTTVLAVFGGLGSYEEAGYEVLPTAAPAAS